MNRTLQKIYQEVLCYEKDTVKICRAVDDEIEALVKGCADRMEAEETEELKNMLSGVALVAEQAGFEVGVRFVVNMLCSLNDN